MSPDLRRVYGLYRTPRPLIRYVVRSVDVLLRSKLGFAAGLGDPELRLLDPAAGAMDFIRVALRVVAEGRPLAPEPSGRFLGVELVEEEHACGVAALQRLLAAAGCQANPAAAVLGDALEPLADLLENRFNVVVGNPPWRGRSSNRGAWITELLRGYTLPDGRQDEGYFRVDGRPLGERNPKWLHDDYVKFLRLAQWQIDRGGEGVAGLVLNHNLLAAPTFRGLRRSLLRTFQEIYVLDLHGNSRRREPDWDGCPDDNVFPEIAQGAAIVLLVRKPGLRKLVARADLRGTRAEKLAFLSRAHVGTMGWTEVEPAPAAYLFVKGDRALEREYERGVPLIEIFPVHGVGIVTGRDAVATALDRTTLERRLTELRQLPSGLPPGDRSAVEALRGDGDWRSKLVRFLAAG
jgi:predicted helicase